NDLEQRGGRPDYLAVAAPKRIAQMPDVPTVAEAGGPTELDVNSFVSLLSPKGVDAGVREKIRSDVVAVLQDPQVKEKFATFAFQPMGFTVAEMQQFAKKKSEQYKLLIEKAHISLD
ncbi:MAG: tripartite tricarboxylate transporter substrate-binding protein, partial [Comamonas sp.]